MTVVTRPTPTWLYHFTHIDHLPSVISNGLQSDTLARSSSLNTVEVGNQRIKEARRARAVEVVPHGVVADYVPFYYAPRSPMMYAIHCGSGVEYRDGCDKLIYLLTTVERLAEHRVTSIYTDRNAVLAFAQYATEPRALDELVDWDLMAARYWNNTPDDSSRRERRMAECLAHNVCPWPVFSGIATYSDAYQAKVRAVLAQAGVSTSVVVRRGWYF